MVFLAEIFLGPFFCFFFSLFLPVSDCKFVHGVQHWNLEREYIIPLGRPYFWYLFTLYRCKSLVIDIKI